MGAAKIAPSRIFEPQLAYVIGGSGAPWGHRPAPPAPASSGTDKMSWTSPDSALSRLLSGDPWAILLAFVVALSLPILLHSFLYRTSSRHTATPTFLLLGISGAGKTSLLTLVRVPLLFAPTYTLVDLIAVAPTPLRATVHLYRPAMPDPHLSDPPNCRPSPALVHSSRLEPLPFTK